MRLLLGVINSILVKTYCQKFSKGGKDTSKFYLFLTEIIAYYPKCLRSVGQRVYVNFWGRN